MTIGAGVDIAVTIQTSVAPVFLLAGIAGILNVIATRLARAVDRSRVVEQLHAQSLGVEHARHVRELRVLDRRIVRSNLATTLCAASALLVCLLITTLFVSSLASIQLGQVIALMFVATMLLLAGGLIAFLSEIKEAVSSLRIREDLLER